MGCFNNALKPADRAQWQLCANQEKWAHRLRFLYSFTFAQYNKVAMLKNNQSQVLVKIILIGNSGVGKSCMLMRFVENTFTTAFYNTIGVDFKIKNTSIDDRKVRMQLWDTAGQDRFRTITSTYYKGAHGVMLVYDVTDRDSFESITYWMSEVEKHGSQNVNRILVANKCDQTQKRKISYEEGAEFASQQGLEFIEVSALSSTNISEAFELIARQVIKKFDLRPGRHLKIPQTKLAAKKEQEVVKGCCSY